MLYCTVSHCIAFTVPIVYAWFYRIVVDWSVSSAYNELHVTDMHIYSTGAPVMDSVVYLAEKDN